MPLIETLISGIGTSVAGAIVKMWLKDQPILSSASESVISILGKHIPDVRKRNATARQLDAIGERAADSIRSMLQKEASDISEVRLEVIANAASLAISSSPIDAKILAQRDLEPQLLKEYFLQRTSAQGGNPGLASNNQSSINIFSEREKEIYERALAHSSQLIVDVASQLPLFSEKVLGEILKRETDLSEKSDRIIDGLDRLLEAQKGEDAGDDVFETSYRSACIRRLDHLELFGVDLQQSNKRYKLSVAYVTLEVEQIRGLSHGRVGDFFEQDLDVEVDRDAMPVDRAISLHKKIFVRGPAGSGKTTLMQWVAVFTAGRDMTGDLSSINQCVPFLVRLRDYADGPLPGPEDFPQNISTALGGKPEDWVHRTLVRGNGIILIDGVDEAAESRRNEIKNWLLDLTKQYPESRFIVTSRPHAAKEGWLDTDGFVDASLQSMKRQDIYNFVDHWHDAVMDGIADSDEKNKMRPLSHLLKERLKEDSRLFHLAGSPLLCAILCALHRDRKEDLPRDRVELYRACVEMFFRRDRERKVSMEGYPELSDRQKHKILQNFAWWLIKNGKSAATPDETENRFRNELKQLADCPKNANGAGVLRLMIERVGILRQLAITKVDFPHRTFQEYLAAHEAIADEDFGLLVKNAHEDQWREVVILAAALMDNPIAAEKFIISLLSRGDSEVHYKTSLYTVAASALDSVVRLPGNNNLKNEVERRIASILPPQILSAAKEVAAGGDLVVKYLKFNSKWGVRQVAASIRALSIIGTDAAVEALCGYGSDSRVGVSKELLRAVSALRDKQSAILAASISSLSFSNTHELRMCELDQFKSLEEVDVNWSYGNKNLKFLKPNNTITQFRLVGSGIESLDGISNLKLAENVRLLNFSRIKNLDGVDNMKSLKILIIAGCIDLITLNGLNDLPSLTDATFSECVKLNSIKSIGNISSICRLSIYSCNLLDSIDWEKPLLYLESLSLISMRQLSSIENIKFAENLKNLTIRCDAALTDLTPVSKLKSLKSLNLSGAGMKNADFCRDLQELEVLAFESCYLLTDISILKNLKNLKILYIINCINISNEDAFAVGASLPHTEFEYY